jgi:cell division protein FtsL
MNSLNRNIKEKKTGKKISVFYVLIGFFVFAFIIGIYINNVLIVNELTVNNNNLKESFDKEMQKNDMLRSEMEKLSSYERIRVIATEKLELRFFDTAINDSNYLVVGKSDLQ